MLPGCRERGEGEGVGEGGNTDLRFEISHRIVFVLFCRERRFMFTRTILCFLLPFPVRLLSCYLSLHLQMPLCSLVDIFK